jgi:dTDP-4-amino-4,6-dideoxygalactose transaminase
MYNLGLSAIREVVCPKALPGTEPIYHVYVILVPDRDALQKFLTDQGIETGIHYPYSLNVLPAYAHLKQGEGHYPRAEYACAHMLSLPMHPCITQDEVHQVCAAIGKFFGR